MSKLFGFSTSRLALIYIALGVLALALFAIPLWYAWRTNISTFRAYVNGAESEKLVEIFRREGPQQLAAMIEAQATNASSDEVIVLADPAKHLLAGNLAAWPTNVPDAPGTYGLVIGTGGGATMRVVVSHVALPGGYHLLMGRESIRFESLVERFWYGITGAMLIVLVLGAVIGWLGHRGLLSEVDEISRTAAAIVEGDLSRRVATRTESKELGTLAQTVNGMLEQLASKNLQLESEIAVRRQAEEALHRAHADLEQLVAERTAQLGRANDSLRRAESYLAEAQKLSLTGSFGWKVSSGEIYWSEETFRIFEYEPSTRPTVERVLQRTHPEDRALVRELIDRVSHERKGFDFDHRLLMSDGSVKHIRVVAHPSAEDQSCNLEFVGAVTDITERKRLERQLVEDQERFRLLSESSLTGVYLIQDGRFRYVNPMMAKMFGYDVEEIIDQLDPLDLTHPDDRHIVEENVSRRVEGEIEGIHYDFRGLRKDGSLFYIEVHGRRIMHDGKIGVIGTLADITERKQAEQRLMTQHTVTQLLAGASTLEDVTPRILQTVCEFLLWDVGALWSVDSEAGVLRCVRTWHKESAPVPEFEAACRDTTFMPGIGLPGRVWFRREPAYIPDVARDSNFQRAPIVFREILHAAFGFPILLGGEVLAVMEFFSHEIRQPDQELLNMMATLGSQIGQFIERKRAEDALQRAQMELAHVSRVATLGEMTASIAHEINQPLGAIVNSANACLRWLDAQKLEEARQSAARAIEEGHRASEIIGRIRALAKKTPPRKDWLDVNETIQGVIALARSEVQRNGVAVETQLSEQVPAILADRIQLQQVILNLMMNAIEALGGNHDGPRELLIRSEPHPPHGVLVAVQDSGPGIDPKTVDHLFEAFYTTKPEGLGMGLAISRSLIEVHGGRLWVTANAPRGAVFQFTLPIDGERAV